MWVIFFAGKCCNYQKQKRKKKNSPRQNQRNRNCDVFFCKIRTCQQDVGYWF